MTIDESMLYEMGYNRGFKDGIKGSIPKADYENRLKADLVAMLTEIQLEIDEIPIVTRHGVTGTVMTAQGMRKKIKENNEYDSFY